MGKENEMKLCTTCGKELRDDESVCPYCQEEQPHEPESYAEAEYVLDEEEPEPATAEPEPAPEPEPEPPGYTEPPCPAANEPKRREPEPEPKKRVSGLSIASFICVMSAVLFLPGLILAIVDLAKNKRKRRKVGLSVAALVIGIIFLLICVFGVLVPLLREAGSNRIVSITGGSKFVAGLKKDGTVVVQTTDPFFKGGYQGVSEWTDIVALDVNSTGECLVGLKKDGTPVFAVPEAKFIYAMYRRDVMERQLKDWTDIVEVDAEGYAIFGLKKDGMVKVAYFDMRPEFQFEPDQYNAIENWTGIVKIKAIDERLYGWKKDGTILCLTTDEAAALMPYRGSVADLEGPSHAEAALLKNGDAVYLWDGYDPESSDLHYDFPNWHGVKKLIVTYRHAIGLKEDGTVDSVYFPGSKEYNEVLDTYVTIYGGNDYGESDVTGWTDIIDICGDENTTFGLRKDGTVVCAGAASEWFDADAWAKAIQ